MLETKEYRWNVIFQPSVPHRVRAELMKIADNGRMGRKFPYKLPAWKSSGLVILLYKCEPEKCEEVKWEAAGRGL